MYGLERSKVTWKQSVSFQVFSALISYHSFRTIYTHTQLNIDVFNKKMPGKTKHTQAFWQPVYPVWSLNEGEVGDQPAWQRSLKHGLLVSAESLMWENVVFSSSDDSSALTLKSSAITWFPRGGLDYSRRLCLFPISCCALFPVAADVRDSAWVFLMWFSPVPREAANSETKQSRLPMRCLLNALTAGYYHHYTSSHARNSAPALGSNEWRVAFKLLKLPAKIGPLWKISHRRV